MTRPSASQRGYGAKWREARAAYLKQHPRCVICGAPATDVDHQVRHKGDPALFWDRTRWRSLCSQHHKHKSGREAHGLEPRYQGCDVDGMPLDPKHSWNRK